MEDSSVTDVTLDIYREMRRDYERVGAVIQSCLRRSRQDVIDLMAEGPTDIRLCKGIYIEPEDIAYTDYEENRNSFSEILDLLLEGGARVGIATHDPVLVERALASLKRFGVDKDQYEFQMLYGVTPELRKSIVEKGHRMRVYVPYGSQWFAYSTRRLKENPKMASLIIKALFFRG